MDLANKNTREIAEELARRLDEGDVQDLGSVLLHRINQGIEREIINKTAQDAGIIESFNDYQAEMVDHPPRRTWLDWIERL